MDELVLLGSTQSELRRRSKIQSRVCRRRDEDQGGQFEGLGDLEKVWVVRYSPRGSRIETDGEFKVSQSMVYWMQGSRRGSCGLGRARISREAKLRTYRVAYVPMIIYGHEAWGMTVRTRSRMQAAQMRFFPGGGRGIRTQLDKCRTKAVRREIQIKRSTLG